MNKTFYISSLRPLKTHKLALGTFNISSFNLKLERPCFCDDIHYRFYFVPAKTKLFVYFSQIPFPTGEFFKTPICSCRCPTLLTLLHYQNLLIHILHTIPHSLWAGTHMQSRKNRTDFWFLPSRPKTLHALQHTMGNRLWFQAWLPIALYQLLLVIRSK